VAAPGKAASVGALLVGLVSVATLPVAVFLTRFSDSYELLHAGFAIPLAAVLGLLAILLARRSRRVAEMSVRRYGGSRLRTAGRLLGIAGICLAAAGLVALGTYEFLEYWGGRD
jgi:hypothetical protein